MSSTELVPIYLPICQNAPVERYSQSITAFYSPYVTCREAWVVAPHVGHFLQIAPCALSRFSTVTTDMAVELSTRSQFPHGRMASARRGKTHGVDGLSI